MAVSKHYMQPCYGNITVMRMIKEDHPSSMSEEQHHHILQTFVTILFAPCQYFLFGDAWGVYCFFGDVVASEVQTTSIISAWFKRAF